MNIFYLDPNPRICAEMHCDKHVVKMIIEYAQLLSTAHRVLDGTLCVGLSQTGRKQTRYVLPDDRDSLLYTATHINHPSAIWVRQNKANYDYLYQLFYWLCREYTHRYGKIHATENKLSEHLIQSPQNIGHSEFFAPTPAMPPELKIIADKPIPGRKYDVLASYKNYYIQAKASFAKWKNRNIPEWFINAKI
jgi:hypothetical protein